MPHKLTSHKPSKPNGILQDAGELAVLTPNQGAVRHQFAMVVTFDSEDDLRRAIARHQCAYRNGQRVQELTHE